MNDDDRLWLEDAKQWGWEMPRASWWKRLPVIRHVRAAMARHRVGQWEAFWLSAGLLPRGYDRWVIYGIARGFERSEGAAE